MRRLMLIAPLVLVACSTIEWHHPPDLETGNNVEYRNAAGEVRWCPGPISADQMQRAQGTALLAGGPGAAYGVSRRNTVSQRCGEHLRSRGYAPVGEAPMPLDQLQAMRAREAAEAEADMARRNAAR